MDIWAITTLYRFFPSEFREANFEQFRKHLAQQNIKLAVIEITTEQTEPLLNEGDADLLVQFKTQSILWHKERSLNILTKMLPKECKYVAWLDADCILLEKNWPSKAVKLLEEHCAVQLCSSIDFLKENGDVDFSRNTYVNNLFYANSKKLTASGRIEGSPGFCWMMKRDMLEQVGLYDKTIIGGGDLLFADTACFNPVGRLMISNGEIDTPHYKHFTDWKKRAQHIMSSKKRATCLPGHSMHLYHDERRYRLYNMRHYLLLLSQYNPLTDISVEHSGLYTINNPQIRSLLYTYFWLREQPKTEHIDSLFTAFETIMSQVKELSTEVRLKRRNEQRKEKLKEKRRAMLVEEQERINNAMQIKKGRPSSR